MKEKGKKGALHQVLSTFAAIGSKHINIVFNAPNKSHFAHIAPVISKLIEDMPSHINIIITCSSDIEIHHPNITHLFSSTQLPLWKRIDLFITTEFDVPYWLKTRTIFFGHGIGPKLTYQTSRELSSFDHIFTACQPIHEAQQEVVGSEKIIKIGLPILDEISPKLEAIESYHQLDKHKKTILYAPSWSNQAEQLPNLPKILKKLDTMDEVNLIVSPHPNLLDKNLCKGIDFFSNKKEYKNIILNTAPSPFNTFDIAVFSDIVISDISSIFFEAAALGKITILDGNRATFKHYGAEKVYDQIIDSNQVIDWDTFSTTDITDNFKLDLFSCKREQFIDRYLFNRNKATDKFIRTIFQLLE